MVNQGARKATLHFINLLETMSKSDPDLLIVYSNAAIAAAGIALRKEGLVDDAKDTFEAIFVEVINDELSAVA
ncbi:hypothetical protein mvi_62970 (plasmid) [Methylobacterium indicum]|uniref:Uncharacterized protein n=1 Tax=Methylobacterium indicum TaxID=1775910 RepID=A0A8H8X095_9HYPH|nr:hypothetical protein mvi_62970 [Methylobacterium indicum]